MNYLIKTLIFLLFVQGLFASTYLDEIKRLSFEEIRADYDLDIEKDQVWFGGNIISVLDTCLLENQTLRTKYLQKIESMDGETFVREADDYLYKPVRSTKVIINGEKLIDVPYEIDRTWVLDIVSNDKDLKNTYLFSRSYRIPDCE